MEMTPSSIDNQKKCIYNEKLEQNKTNNCFSPLEKKKEVRKLRAYQCN